MRYEARQQARLAALVAYARAHSPFYRDRPPLAVTTKAELMENFDDGVTDRAVTWRGVSEFIADPDRAGTLYQGRYQIVTSSGTSGRRGVFVQDKRMHRILSIITVTRASGSWLTARDYLRMLRRGNRVAAIWATGGHFAGWSTARRLILARPVRQRSIRLLSVHEPLDELVEKINAFDPTIINGYAGIVAALAREQQAGRLHIRPLLVITSAEGLPPGERARIREAFRTTVRDQYACSEFMGLAHGCDQDWLHVNADWAILEPVDENFAPVPPGQPSHSVLLTNLANRVQPIIRYDLGDSITVRPDPCPCGSTRPAIRAVGRTAAMLSFTGPEGRAVDLPPLALGTLVDRTPGVRIFQIVQTGADRLAVRLIADDDAWPRVHRELRGLLDRHGLTGVRVERDPLPPQRTPGGKLRTVYADLRGGEQR